MPEQDGSEPALEKYLRNGFLPSAAEPLSALPLEDESHVAFWKSWLADTKVTWSSLAAQIPQLSFGVGEGVSKQPEYKDVMFGGHLDAIPDSSFEGVGPIEVTIEAHWAGHLPVIHIVEREDFEMLYRILAQKGEPVGVSHQVHAVMLAGLVSPVRIAATRDIWHEGGLRDDPLVAGCVTWADAMQAIDKGDKSRFRDRLLILQDVPYADLRAEEAGVGLGEEEWLTRSRVIRKEHEFAHYATRRLFSNMRLNLHDELVADCMGFTAAFGRFDSDLFLRGLGIDGAGKPAPDSRCWTYVQELDGQDVERACAIAVQAARNVEAWIENRGEVERSLLLRTLAANSLPELATDHASDLLAASYGS